MESDIRLSAVGDKEMEDWEKPFQSVLGCMLLTALIASRQGIVDDVEAILAPLEAVRPSHPSVKLARAIVYLNSGRPQEVVDLLGKDLLSREPDNEMARVIYAWGQSNLGNLAGAMEILNEVIRSGRTAAAAALARELASDPKFNRG